MAVIVQDKGLIGSFLKRRSQAHLHMFDHAFEYDGVDRVSMMMKGEFGMANRVRAVMSGVKIMKGKEVPQSHMILAAMLQVMGHQLAYAEHLVQEHARTQDLQG